jgi:transposase-like protein
LAQLPRRCPICDQDTIIGHGRRRKQAHDERHDWIWVRRGRCPACKKTFTVLPTWSAPYGHYSYNCRQQAWDATLEGKPAPHCWDATRLPDDSTAQRWAWRKFVSLWTWITTPFRAAADFFGTPTILAWDLAAAGRILHLEANSP